MPGAGNLIAANYVYNKAEPDGLTVGHFSGSMIFKHILGDQGVMFDGKKFGWLGTPAPERHTCVVTEKTGIKNLEEWSASKRPVKLGSLGPGNATSALPQLLRAVLGLPINVVEGFKGTSDIRLAAEAGEIDGACWGWDSIKVTWAKAIESGFVRPIIQTTLEPFSDQPNIPVAVQQAKTKEGQDLLRFGFQAYGPSAIAYSAPPGVPKDRMLLLQKAFMATMKDPEFLTETKKASLIVNPIDGPTIAKIVGDLYSCRSAAGFQVSGNYRGDSGAKITRDQSVHLERRSALVPIGCLLVGMGHIEDKILLKRAGGDLHPDGRSRAGKTTAHIQGRQTGYIEWNGTEAVGAAARILPP